MRSYLSYLKNVLGVNEFLTQMPAYTVAAEAPLADEKKWRVLFLTQSEWSGAERALFLKITEAMKLSQNDFVVHEISPESITEILDDVQLSQHVVCFTFELQSALQALGFEVHFSPDPKAMMKNPGLKKEAWNVLKKL